MSDYHVLTQDEKNRSISVVFHIPIPATGVNEAGFSWRNAIVKEQGGSANIISSLPDISKVEDTALKAGEIFEKQTIVRFSSVNLSNAQRKIQIETMFDKIKTDLVAEKQITLQWIGYSADAI